MKTCIQILLLALVPVLIATAEPTELPDPPAGFEWVRLPEINGAFLKPVSWHFLAEERGGTQGYFLTEQNIESEGRFLTGLTINVVRNSQERTNRTAPDYARSFIAMAAEAANEEVLESWESSVSTLEGFGVLVRNTSDPETPTIIHRLAIGNSSTDTLYILFFESPEPTWENAWKFGEVMLKMFLIDDEI